VEPALEQTSWEFDQRVRLHLHALHVLQVEKILASELPHLQAIVGFKAREVVVWVYKSIIATIASTPSGKHMHLDAQHPFLRDILPPFS
jgi:hypothetical protein